MQARLEELYLKYQKSDLYHVSTISISFEYENENELKVYITTPRLELESTSLKHTASYIAMTQVPETMRLYGLGHTWTPEYTQTRTQKWDNLWKQDNPFSSFAVFDKVKNEESADDERKKGAFIGHEALDYDESAPKHYAESSYIFRIEYQGKGYGSEALYAVSHCYTEEILRRERYSNKCNGETLEGVYLSARPDNFSSFAIAIKNGFRLKQTDFKPIETKWGPRLTFFKTLRAPVVATATIEEKVENNPIFTLK